MKENSITPNWFDRMWRILMGFQQDRFSDKVRDLKDNCRNCYVWRYLDDLVWDYDWNSYMLSQFVADLLALLIGGPSTCFALIDMFLNSCKKGRYFPDRPSFLLGYCSQSNLGEYASTLQTEIMKMMEGWYNYLPISVPLCPYLEEEESPCYSLLLEIGERSGRVFSYFESEVLRELMTELPTEKVVYPSGVNSITSALIKERFSITREIEERICSRLRARETCPEEDLRHFLHCYYKTFREGMVPDYATSLYSLAYNTYQKNMGRS